METVQKRKQQLFDLTDRLIHYLERSEKKYTNEEKVYYRYTVQFSDGFEINTELFETECLAFDRLINFYNAEERKKLRKTVQENCCKCRCK